MKDNHHTYYEEFLSSTECKELSELALREEPRVMDIDNPYRDVSTYDGLTGQYLVYNWLSHPHVQSLNIPKRLFDLPDLKDTNHIAVQCWMNILCLLYTSPSPRDGLLSRMPSSA